MNGEPVAIFERAGNKNLWKKVRNTASGSHCATAENTKGFLTQRDINAKDAEAMLAKITNKSGTISARGFEELLQREGKATDSETALYQPTQF